jgi:hypothetical protein
MTGARRYGSNDVAFDDAFGLFWIFHLLANGNGAPGLDGFGNVGVDGAYGHTCHGDAAVVVVAVAGGQGDAKQFGGLDSVFEEKFVEIAHAEEEKGITALGLCLYILAKHGRELIGCNIFEFFPVRRHGRHYTRGGRADETDKEAQ